MSLLRRATAAAVLLGLALAPSAAANPLGPPEAHSPNAEEIRVAYWVMAVIAVIAIIAVHAALFRAIARNRDDGERKPARTVAGRRAMRGLGTGLGALALVIFILGVVLAVRASDFDDEPGPEGLQAQSTRLAQAGISGAPAPDTSDVGPVTLPDAGSPDDPSFQSPLEIQVYGQQWLWRFEYPGGRTGDRNFTYNELVVPVDTPVVLSITSTDVMHRWFVPELGGQVDAVPGEFNQTWFLADEEGLYEGRSTRFSGAGFPSMRAWVRVVSVNEYRQYIEDLSADLDEAQAAVQDEVDASNAEATGEDGAAEIAPAADDEEMSQ